MKLSKVIAVAYKPIFFSLVTFFLLAFLGSSNDRVSNAGMIFFMVAIPTMAGSIVGFFMLDVPTISLEFATVRISIYEVRYLVGAIIGAIVGAGILAFILISISLYPSLSGLYLGQGFTYALVVQSFGSGLLLGSPLGALGSTSVIAGRLRRNLSIVLLGVIGSLIFDPIKVPPYTDRPFLYIVSFPALFAIILSLGFRYGKKKLEPIGFSKLFILLILLNSAWLGTCLGIWIKLKTLSFSAIISSLLSVTLLFLTLLNHWFVHRKLPHGDSY